MDTPSVSEARRQVKEALMGLQHAIAVADWHKTEPLEGTIYQATDGHTWHFAVRRPFYTTELGASQRYWLMTTNEMPGVKYCTWEEVKEAFRGRDVYTPSGWIRSVS